VSFNVNPLIAIPAPKPKPQPMAVCTLVPLKAAGTSGDPISLARGVYKFGTSKQCDFRFRSNGVSIPGCLFMHFTLTVINKTHCYISPFGETCINGYPIPSTTQYLLRLPALITAGKIRMRISADSIPTSLPFILPESCHSQPLPESPPPLYKKAFVSRSVPSSPLLAPLLAQLLALPPLDSPTPALVSASPPSPSINSSPLSLLEASSSPSSSSVSLVPQDTTSSTMSPPEELKITHKRKQPDSGDKPEPARSRKRIMLIPKNFLGATKQ
jgi:hypothetical protein